MRWGSRSGYALKTTRIQVFGKVKGRRRTWLPRVSIEVGEPINPIGLDVEQIQARMTEALS